MEHILIVGLLSKVYKVNPIARLYIDDAFLDEYDLSSTNYDLEGFAIAKADNLANVRPYAQSSPKIYEFDTEHKEDLTIKIQIFNDDNNFCNGFMTQYTKIIMDYIFVIPKKVFLNYSDYYNRHVFGKSTTVSELKKIKNWYDASWVNHNNNMILFNNYCSHVFWKGKNSSVRRLHQVDTIGESGEYTLRLKKKFGMYIPKTFNKGILRMLHPYDLEYFFTKYRSNENK